ncbi:hypothetical protein NDU88_004534 [Pleurodeles waltl]|uniref:Uncharacterized protein n=1 Tax=Pleurodeles waltl TaxID=8319 RepID=A0AAV7V209_PLEWA|nr:hypothetical protein NDU88_004534 [Pleurodeles waltl]
MLTRVYGLTADNVRVELPGHCVNLASSSPQRPTGLHPVKLLVTLGWQLRVGAWGFSPPANPGDRAPPEDGAHMGLLLLELQPSRLPWNADEARERQVPVSYGTTR